MTNQRTRRVQTLAKLDQQLAASTTWHRKVSKNVLNAAVEQHHGTFEKLTNKPTHLLTPEECIKVLAGVGIKYLASKQLEQQLEGSQV